MARRQGAEVINFDEEDPVKTILELTGGVGMDCAIDAVGVDAQCPHHGPASEQAAEKKEQFQQEVDKIKPLQHPDGANWVPGDAPSQAQQWAVQALAKAGTLSIIGVYPPADNSFPIGAAMNKNLTIRMGNCNHRKYVPDLVELVRTGAIDPTAIITQREGMDSVIDAYKEFDLPPGLAEGRTDRIARRPRWLRF
jgi:threonine dehydrogenase-like Zn-dependent dehydrogenase